MSQVIVISTLAQYECALARGLNFKDWIVLCDNERIYGVLREREVVFRELTEFDFRDLWNDINAWGWQKAAGLIRLAETEKSFKSCDFPSIIFLWLTVVLILALKNRIRAQKIFDEYRPEKIAIFRPQTEYVWPEYSGNAFLNEFLKECTTVRRCETLVFDLAEPRAAVLPDSSSKLKKAIRKGIKDAIHLFYGWAVKPPAKADVMVYGTLRHLASVSVLLRERGARVVFYDDEFRKEHFQFCRKHQITYLLPACFPMKDAINTGPWAARLRAEWDAFLHETVPADYFSFQSLDLNGFIRSRILGESMSGYFSKLARQWNLYENIYARCGTSSLLLDEDFNAHAPIAAFMKQKGLPVFCISHANMALECKLSAEDGAFAQSFTFVHAPHEKDTYVERGWVQDQLIVTGMPRYDRLVQAVKDGAKQPRPGSSRRILYCAGLLWPYSPDVLGFVGCDMYGFRRSQEQAVRFLLESVRGLDVTVVIKPHYAEDEAMWRELIAREGDKCCVEVVKASEDYFKLLLESDAMVLCLWSSTLIEAGLAGVPVYYLDLEGQNSGQAKRLAESGLCEIFSDPNVFRRRLEEKESASAQKEIVPKKVSPAYFLGAADAAAGERVADFILKQIKAARHV